MAQACKVHDDRQHFSGDQPLLHCPCTTTRTYVLDTTADENEYVCVCQHHAVCFLCNERKDSLRVSSVLQLELQSYLLSPKSYDQLWRHIQALHENQAKVSLPCLQIVSYDGESGGRVYNLICQRCRFSRPAEKCAIGVAAVIFAPVALAAVLTVAAVQPHALVHISHVVIHKMSHGRHT